MEGKCEICGKDLGKEISWELFIEKFFICFEKGELEFEKELNKYYDIYCIIGSCFYCDVKRLYV